MIIVMMIVMMKMMTMTKLPNEIYFWLKLKREILDDLYIFWCSISSGFERKKKKKKKKEKEKDEDEDKDEDKDKITKPKKKIYEKLQE